MPMSCKISLIHTRNYRLSTGLFHQILLQQSHIAERNVKRNIRKKNPSDNEIEILAKTSDN
jgi:hypothetical protein